MGRVRVVKRAAVTALTFDDRLSFEISGESLEKVRFKVFSSSEGIEVDMEAETLLYLLDRLRFIAESVISELGVE